MPLQKTVEISAPPSAVWAVLIEPARVPEWMGGITVETTWVVGSPIAFVRTLTAREYRDSGTVLAVEPQRLVQYDLWSSVTRLPDLPGHRARITIALEATEAGTQVTVTHEAPPAEAAVEHARWFWGVALAGLKRVVEARAAT